MVLSKGLYEVWWLSVEVILAASAASVGSCTSGAPLQMKTCFPVRLIYVSFKCFGDPTWTWSSCSALHARSRKHEVLGSGSDWHRPFCKLLSYC